MSPAAGRVVRASSIAIAVVLAAYAAYVAFAKAWLPGLEELVTTWLWSALLLATAGICLARATLCRADRTAWLLLGVGMVLWSVGTVVFSIFYAHLDEPPYPSIADYLYLGLYPCAYAALMLLAKRRVRSFYASVWLDGLIGMLAVGAIGATLVEPLVLAETDGSVAAVATQLAFPLADVVLIAFVVGMFALTGWKPGRAWLLAGIGFVLMTVADTLYLYRVADGTFVVGTLLDAVWPAGMVLLAFAAWQTAERPGTRTFDGWAPLVAPSMFILGALGVLVYGVVERINVVALLLAAATIVAALGRTALSFREVRVLAESRRQATTDELTGLPNRRRLYECVEQNTANARREGSQAALLIADLDGFKELNDTLGHYAGDLLLKQLGPRLRDVLRDQDILARLGGDEFAILLPRCDRAGAVEVIERVQAALEQPFPVRGLTVHIEASMGMALFPQHGHDADTLLQRADVAMYQAKNSRTGFEIYESSRDVHSLDRLSLLGDLRRAIDADELMLHYQPQGSMDTGRVTSVEALVRWAHPTRGLLSPAEFIPLAEQTGLMRPLTMSVLDQALAQCRRWLERGIRLDIAVNLSVPNLLDLKLPEDVDRLLTQWRVPPEQLQLEVTENVVTADPVRVLEVLERLKALGVGLSLDDFGTGSSSLSFLKRLPVNELKIDKSFVLNMENDEADAVIVRSTTELAQRLGLRVVAEGVESAAVWRRLSAFGCELAQGFYLCRPVHAEDLIEWLERSVPTGAGAASSAERSAGSLAAYRPA